MIPFEVPVPCDKIVEKLVVVEKEIEKIKEVPRQTEKLVEVIKEVAKDQREECFADIDFALPVF